MVTTEITADVPPERVFDVLSDGRSFGDWVVGSSEIRAVDPGWPQPGSRFHHTIGWGPLKIADHTESLESIPPSRLRMRARARPFGSAMVTLDLHPLDGGATRIVMSEGPADVLTALVLNPLMHPLIRLRNNESLRRLKRHAEGRGPAGHDAARP
jgi:uncharacterized protein YndB with AHSA1/START domain